MRILQVVPYFPPAYAFGGPAKVVYQMCAQLSKRGHDITVYTTDAKDLTSRLNVECAALLDGLKVYYFKNFSMMLVKWSKLFLTPQILSIVKDEIETFDVVHLHEYFTLQNVVIHRYARRHNIPYVLQPHGSLPRIMTKRRLKSAYNLLFGYRLLRDASRLIALNRTEAQQWREAGLPSERIRIVPNGIDLSEYESPPRRNCFRQKFNIQSNKKIILYLGRIHKMKGIDFLIESYAYALKNSVLDNAVLVIAGPDDGYLNSAKSLVRLLRLTDKVVFTGFLTEHDKKCVLVDSDLVVYPNPSEPFGLVTLEAAALARPVIVSNNTPMADVVRRGKFGFSAEYGDVKGLAILLRNVLGDEESRHQLGKNGRQYVLGHFNWKEIAAMLEHIYRGVIDSSNDSWK